MVDNEGIRAFRAIRRFEEILSLRQALTDAADLQHDADGLLLERWFLKHAVNLFVVSGTGKQHWHGGSLPSKPPQQIVKAAFGLVKLQHPLGLYNWAGTRFGERRVVGNQVGFQPLFDSAGEFLGGLFDFQALSFLIWLSDSTSKLDIDGTALAEFYHHMGGIFEAPPLGANFGVHWS